MAMNTQDQAILRAARELSAAKWQHERAQKACERTAAAHNKADNARDAAFLLRSRAAAKLQAIAGGMSAETWDAQQKANRYDP